MTGKRSALIVATSDYKDGRLAHLDGPARDAEALRGVLAQKDIGGFEVRLALNARADTLRRTLETFFADRARDDLLLLHFSGHGLKDDDGQLYLAAADTQIDRLLSTGIDAGWVNRLMTRCRSEKIALFLDCCFAGAFTSGMARRVGVDTAGVNEHFTGTGRFVITASDAMQYAFESGRQVGDLPEPSPFTQALVDGLASGEADRNEDGNVSMDELFDYLEDRIRETSPSQTPTKSAFNQVGDWIIARSTRAPTVRLLPEDVQQLLKSEEALERFGALIELRDLIEDPDRRVAQAAIQALERLARDDSRRVAAAAQRMLDEEEARPKSGGRGSRRLTARDLAPATRAAPAVDQIEADEAPSETASIAAEPEASAIVPEATEALRAPEIAAEAPEQAPAAVVAPPGPTPVIGPAPAPAASPEPALAAPAPPPLAAPPGPAVVAPPTSIATPAPSPVVPGWPAPTAPPAPAPVAPTPPAPVAPPPRVSHWVEPDVRQPAARPAEVARSEVAPPSVVPPSSVTPARADPVAATSPQARTEASPGVHWSLGRAAGRAVVGGFLWVLFQYFWYLVTNQWIFDNQAWLDEATNAFSEIVGLVAVATGIIVVAVEFAVPALRVPSGRAYRSINQNRWLAAAIVGVAASITIGLTIEYVYLTAKSYPISLGWEIPFCGILGFLVAEAVFGRAGQVEG